MQGDRENAANEAHVQARPLSANVVRTVLACGGSHTHLAFISSDILQCNMYVTATATTAAAAQRVHNQNPAQDETRVRSDSCTPTLNRTGTAVTHHRYADDVVRSLPPHP